MMVVQKEKNMKKVVFVLAIFSMILSVPACFARPMGGMHGGRMHGGMYGGRMHGGMHGGINRPQVQKTRFYYRPVQPVTPAMTRHNTVPATPVSCLGTSSYITIGNNVMPCQSAAATRIKKSK